MLSRRPRSIPFTLPTSSSPPSFPGLVSCLRPIKRLILQLSDESSLLHRFSYKNKNQHKASKWWNKLIGVDRIMFRLDEELNSLLQGFGSKDSEEQTSITREQVVTGFLQLPRSILLVEKSIQILLDCASILQQLIETRAFLAFSLIVVSLIARLHTLSVVLREELDKLSKVLLGLIDSNNLMESVEPLLKKLPKELQRLIQPHSVPSSPPPLASSSSKDVTFMEIGEGGIEGGDDLGAVMARRKPIELKDKGEEKTRVIPIKRRPSPEVIPSQEEEEEIVSPPPMKKLKKLKKLKNSLEGVKTKGTGRKEDEGIGFLSPLESSLQPLKKKERMVSKESDGVVVKKKKKLVTEAGDEMVVRKKKKKKPRPSGEGDEIDAIFG